MTLRGVVGSPAHITRRGPTAPGDKQALAERLTREAGDEQHPGKAGCTRDSLGALGHGLPLRPRPRRCCWRPSASRAAKRYRRACLPVPTRGEMPTRPPRGTAGDTDRRFQHELTKRSGWPPRPPAQTLRWRTSRLGGH